jgi:hypothetical protein
VAHGFFYALFGTAVATMADQHDPLLAPWRGYELVQSLLRLRRRARPHAIGVFLSDHFGYVPMFLVGAAVALASLPLLFRVKAAAPE